MFYKGKIRVYIMSCIVMLLASLFSLVVLSALIYLFKWQSDRAMGGIVIVYILTGLAGGKAFGWIQNWQNKEKCHIGIKIKVIEALLLSMSFFLVLMFISIFFLANPFEMSARILMISVLLTSSCFLGRIL